MLIKRFILKYLFLCALTLIVIGCSSKEPEIKNEKESINIEKLFFVPQDVNSYIDNLQELEKPRLLARQEKFAKYYFQIWNKTEPPETLESIMWPFRVYKATETFGDNLRPLEQNFFDEMLEQSHFDAYGTINQNAITTKYANLRLFPTERAVLRDPNIAGEGFPFDYVQNSSIAANKPLFISHYSKHKDWAFAFSSFASGWIKVSDFVFLQKSHTDSIQNAQHIFLIHEGIPIYDEKKNFLFRSRVGMSLPLIEEDQENYTVLSISSYMGFKPLFVRSKISKKHAHKDFLPFKQENMQQILQEVSKTSYGWGGMFEQRDCSSMLRDIYIPFGVWLPRNSYQQSKVGKILSLEELSDEAKIQRIKEKGIPFETLLYKKGHIVLYVGTYNNEVVVFHNTWGIKTNHNGKDGRVVIGDTLFSTLRLGEELPHYDKNGEILKNLKTMNIVTH